MTKFSITKNPIFVPKIQGSEAAFVHPNFGSAFLMDAHIVAYFPKPAKKVAKICETFIIDPVTNYFIEKSYVRKASFRKLPYSPPKAFAIEDLLVDEKLRIKKMIEPAINYQVNNGAKIIILPYLFTESPTDVKFGLNLNMVADSIKYIQNKKIKKPIFAMINIGSSILDDPKTLNYIIERYDDDFGEKIQGYCIMLDQFMAKDSREESLGGLAHLAFQLARNKDVFIFKIGAFGEVLSAIGASGFSSGLCTGESFSKESLRKELSGFGRPLSKWTYIPELFDHIHDESINRTDYKCDCPACKGAVLKNIISKKAHFLHRRMKTMKILRALSRDKRITLMQNRLNEGIKLATTYNRKYNLSLKTSYLIRWRNTLELAKSWSYRNDRKKKDADLDRLIHEARVKRKK